MIENTGKDNMFTKEYVEEINKPIVNEVKLSIEEKKHLQSLSPLDALEYFKNISNR